MDDNFLMVLEEKFGVQFGLHNTYSYDSGNKVIRVKPEANPFWRQIVLHEVGHALNKRISDYHMQDEVLAWETAEKLAKELNVPWTPEVEKYKVKCLASYKIRFIRGKWRYRGWWTRYHPAPVTCGWFRN